MLKELTSDIKREMKEEFDKVNASHKADKILDQQMLAKFDQISQGMDIVTTPRTSSRSSTT